MEINIQSEAFAATGGTSAAGVWNQLGRPKLDRLSLLVREAIQNSWDAQEAASIEFRLEVMTLDEEHVSFLTDTVFRDEAPGIQMGEALRSTPTVIVLSDFGTTGLAGPTRGDVALEPGEPSNFVDFLRFVGRPPDRGLRGGTYGFGKAAYYLASECQTLCVYTRCLTGGRPQSRFMATALGPEFVAGGRRFNGRHWWGRRLQDGHVDPLFDADADAAATAMGLRLRQGAEFGTTTAILAPRLEGDAIVAVRRIARSIVNDFWPKLIDGPQGAESIRFTLRCDGEEVELPLTSAVHLPLFAKAFHEVRAAQGVADPMMRREEIVSLRPRGALGRLALVRDIDLRDSAQDASPLFGASHHVALMRGPNFVVKYLAGPALPNAHVNYAGVFRAHKGVDDAFARSEPPTHDDWSPDLLEDSRDRTFVRSAVRRTKEVVDAFAAPVLVAAGAEAAAPLAEFSRDLGRTLSAGSAPATAAERKSRERAEGAKLLGSLYVGEPTVEVTGLERRMIVRMHHDAKNYAQIGVEARVMTSDGLEREAPLGSALPVIISWLGDDGRELAGSVNVLQVPPEVAVSVVVRMPDDATVSLSCRLVD